MISSVLMSIIIGMFLVWTGLNLIYVTSNAIKEKDKYLITLGIVLNMMFWLTIIFLTLKYFGL